MGRKISHDAAQAFVTGFCMSQRNNTAVEIDGYGTVLRLHGNMIAWHTSNGSVCVSLCGWNSVTTRDRLNALCCALGTGHRFHQQDHEPFFSGNPIGSLDTVVLKPGLGPLGMLAIQAEREMLEQIEADMMGAGEHIFPPGSEQTHLPA